MTRASRSESAQSPELAHVAAVRGFNRFYTRQIGILDRGYLQSPFSLAEARVLYELCYRPTPPSATALSRDLGIDPGYLSRILADFGERRLVKRVTSPDDARRSLLSLSSKGRKVFAELDRRSSREVRALIEKLPRGKRRSVVDAMRTIQSGLAPDLTPQTPNITPEAFAIRTHRPGDMGWVVHRHGALYAQEYGWDERFEALVARICADFLDRPSCGYYSWSRRRAALASAAGWSGPRAISPPPGASTRAPDSPWCTQTPA